MSANPGELIRLVFIGCGGLVLLAFAAGSVFMIVTYFRNKQKAVASQNWSAASGTIIESDIRESKNNTEEGSRTYYPIVIYSYEVLGQAYRGDKINIGARRGGTRGKAQELAARYPVGASVNVYYDPANPADAVLERTAPANTALLILGIIFLVISLCLMVGGLLAVLNTVLAAPAG